MKTYISDNMSCNNPSKLKTENNLIKSVAMNPLNSAFFSKENQKIIQNAIRFNVFKTTKIIIGKQSNTQLDIIMRSIYLQYSENLPYNITEQIIKLNNMVVTHSVPNIVSNIKQHIHYKKALDSNPVLMEHPKNMSSAGEKTLIGNIN